METDSPLPGASLVTRTVLAFLYFFLVIFSYYLLKPVRNSLFIEWVGAASLPTIYLVSAGVCLVAALVFMGLLSRYSPRAVVFASTVVFLGLFVVTWVAFSTPFLSHKSVAIAFYVFNSFFAVMAVSMFWATANDSFSKEEAVAQYGYVGMGGILGGLTGSTLTQYLVTVIGTEPIILVSAGVLALTLPFPILLIRSTQKCDPVIEPKSWVRRAKLLQSGLRSWRMASWKKAMTPPNGQLRRRVHELNQTVVQGAAFLLQNPYFLSIAGIVFLMTLSSTLFDYHFQTVIAAAELGKNARTVYFAKIFQLTSLVGLVVHLTVTRFQLKRFGPVGGLLILPVLGLVAVVLIGVYPDLRMVTIIWPLMGGVTYSIFQVSKENLYIPTDRAFRYDAKFLIDTFVYRLGDAAAGFGLLVLRPAFEVVPWLGGGVILVAMVAWILVIGKANRYYRLLNGGSH